MEEKTYTNRDRVGELNPEAIVWDGFDDAIIGYDRKDGKAVYSEIKMMEILMASPMSEEEAMEYLEFNVFSTYVGEYTPLHIHLFNEYDL